MFWAALIAAQREVSLRKRICSLCVLVFAGAATAAGFAQSAERFIFDQKPGAYAVGLKVVDQYDYSRTWGPAVDDLGKPVSGERARPLQTLIWYPAEKTAGKPMTVGDYFALLETETSFDKPHLPIYWQDWKTGLAPAMQDALWAVRDAPAVAGHYPVVIYAPSFGSMAWENADLCEFLASNGYVVLATGALGAESRDMTNDLAGIDAQARDISFLVGYGRGLANTDMSEVAVAGFSWGGIANLFAAARDTRIDALVALDGSMRYYPGLVKDAGDVHPNLETIPLLFFTEGEFTIEDIDKYLNGPANRGPDPLNEWTHGDLTTVHMMAMIHTEFSSIYQRNENVWKNFAESRKADYPREDGIPGYGWMARYTLAYLDAYLKHDSGAMAWLKKTPAENGAPQHFIYTSFRAASGVPASLEGFKTELGRRGFDQIQEVYAAFHKENPDFKLQEDQVNLWGYTLLGDGHLPEAIAVLKLNTTLYPDSGNTYDSLGDAYAKAGSKDLAMENYRKAVATHYPQAEQSQKKLDELEKAPAAK